MDNEALDAVMGQLSLASLGQFALIILLTALIIRLSARFIPLLAERVPSEYRLSVLSLVPVVRLLSLLAAVILSVPIFIPPTRENLIALLGASGIALGFALKDYVSSLFAGIVSLYERPYKPGDWVEFDGHYGEVKALGLRALTLVTPDDNEIQIPHMKLWTESVSNANSGQRELQCSVDFYIEPSAPLDEVESLLRWAALSSPLIKIRRGIRIVCAQEAQACRVRLRAYPLDGRDQHEFKSDLLKRGKAALASVGIELSQSLTIARGGD